ncbi:hypothetical protein V8E55_007514 [Tylopilus felleus]
MSTQSSKSGYVCRERKFRPGHLRLWAPRCPMAQLPDQYRVTKANPNPPLVHFAIPIDAVVLYNYAAKHKIVHPEERILDLGKAMEHLSEYAEYEIYVYWPFKATADCGLILVLYDNYTMKDKRLIDEDQEDVIQMVQEALGLDKSMRPKWYFDWEDPWVPDDEDEDEDEDEGEGEDTV